MTLVEKMRGWVWDTTTALVADSIALWNPQRANEYRYQRSVYKRAYIAGTQKGPYSAINRPSNLSADREIATASPVIRAKTRDLGRNNPLVAGMKLKRTTAVIGDEIGIKAQIANAGKPSTALNVELERRFYAWAETAMTDGSSLTDAAQLIENHLFEDGEILIKDVVSPAKGANPYRIQLLEADQLSMMHGTNLTGIDYDKGGKALRYWITDRHPGGNTGPGATSSHDAATITHLFERDRASQGRGVSQLAPAVFKLFGVDDLEDAELVASRAACAFGLLIETPTPEVNPFGADDGETEEDDREVERKRITAGGIFIAKPGEKVQSFKNERPNSNFDSFVRGRHRTTAGATGMSYESATGDYSQVNYSSARMGRLIEWAIMRRRQARIKRWLHRVYRKWLSFEASIGIPGLSRSEYNREPSRFWAVSWQLAGNDGIDPTKEASAFEKELAMGVASRTDWAAEHGRDFPELCKKIAEEKALMISLGIYREAPIVAQYASASKVVMPGETLSDTVQDTESEEIPEEPAPDAEPQEDSPK